MIYIYIINYLNSIGFNLNDEEKSEYSDLLAVISFCFAKMPIKQSQQSIQGRLIHIAKKLGFDKLALDLEFAHFNEIEKFNDRFGLKLNQFAYEEDFNSL